MGEPTVVDAAALADLPLPVHGDGATKDGRGSTLVIGGSRQVPGAALLSALASLRAGTGRVQVATATSVAVALAIALPEARVIGLPETGEGEIDGAAAAGQVAELAGRVDAVLIGPGMLDVDRIDPVLAAVCASPGVVVIDAGAMPAAGRALDLLRSRPGATIATPNPGELKLLAAGADPAAAAARLGGVVAARGPDTVIADELGRVVIDRAGCAGLGTSGSGDVAAGLVAGLAARGAPPFTAAVWGCHAHGVAGERLAARVGAVGFLARELLDELPAVLRALSPTQ